ncbi:unnamed protein product [Mytilus coruscus]|uniref:Uncharacterized protein n=1 Tax=Mytilus coruscus TaxID=42192 RepID=A0A6J8CL57_MYTCO|nr:unnamed protein product [Mytilus coruscus]
MEECKFIAKEVGKTFIHSNGVDSTAIDHILYPENVQDDISYVKKLDIVNSFDFSIGSNKLKSSKTDQMHCKVNWNKLDKDMYVMYQESIEKGTDELKTSNKAFDNISLDLNGELMPFVNKTPHIGIQRAYKDSSSATIEENLKKARRSLYSLMATGLHDENGLDLVTAISLLKTYIIPVMLYGLETLIPNGKIWI